MNDYIRLMLSTAQSVGEVVNGDIREASAYLPRAIRFGGISKSGEKFELELTIGEKKKNEDA